MPVNPQFSERVKLIFDRKQVPYSIKNMMGGQVFMVDGKMCVGVDQDRKTGEDRLMARIGPEAYEAALAERGSKEMDFTGKPMRGFVFIYGAGIEREEDLEFWIQKCLDFNPQAKASKKKKKAQ